MVMKRKVLLGTAAFYLVCSTAAHAQMSVQLNLGQPAYMVAPAPAYVSPYPDYYDPGHRRHDYAYWQHRQGHNNGHAGQNRAEHEHR